MIIKFVTNLLIFIVFINYSFATSKFHFAIVGDRTGQANQPVFESVINDIENLHPDLVLNVGDFPEDADINDWRVVLKTLEKLTSPFYFVPGNNDIFDDRTRLLFTELTGFPTYYSFQYENSHFVIVDNSRWENYLDLEEKQITWLVNDLEKNKNFENIFIFMHKPFWYKSVRAEVDPMHELFKNYNVKAVFTGHFHQNAYKKIDNIEYFIIGSSGARFGGNEDVSLGNFYQYMWCTVIDGKLHHTLLKANSTVSSDIMSVEDQLFSYKIKNELISVSATFNDNDQDTTIRIKIINETKNTIKQKLNIDHDDNWVPEISTILVEILPGDIFTKEIAVRKTGPLYPLPIISFSYPFGNQKVINYKKVLDFKRILNSDKANIIPTIDGIIDPKEWDHSKAITDFGEISGLVTRAEKTELYFKHDNKNLYIAVKSIESKIHELKKDATQRDSAVYFDDAFGMIITPNTNETYLIYVNAIGTIYDAKFYRNTSKDDESWNGLIEIKSKIDLDKWTTEIKIPFSEINYDLIAGSIRINTRRKQQRLNSSAVLSTNWSFDIDKHPLLILK